MIILISLAASAAHPLRKSVLRNLVLRERIRSALGEAWRYLVE
jgi:hypothetical protein